MPAASDSLTVALCQIEPVLLDREATLAKVTAAMDEADAAGARLAVFGEALVPGYPVWLARTDGARFDDPRQKELHAVYLDQGVCLEDGHLEPVCEAAKRDDLAVYLGVMERPVDRGGHSLYCSLVHVDAGGEVRSVHRKLMPTYEERLAWSPGDGHGLRTHRLGAFTAGGLNCWENWLPLARAALHGMGEDLHVAVWPGSAGLTKEITRFMALEGRSYVISVSGLYHADRVPDDVPLREEIVADGGWLANGGSCCAAPDGSWILEPWTEAEGVRTVTLDHGLVRRERQNLDISGHYSRPDVLRLKVNRKRQRVVNVKRDGDE